MGRKRKIPVVSEEKENTDDTQSNVNILTHNNSGIGSGPIYTIMSKIQLNETYHKKYIKELRHIYESMDHDAFIYTFINIIKSAMVAEEGNEFAQTTLLFCAKFVGSFEAEETHLLMADTCRWLLTTISNNPHIRFRLCQFVNMILGVLGQEATLDDAICDRILEYMVGRLLDVSPSVRVQAILAMQRLQVPDNPDDPVLRSYQYHLCSDPSPRVRQAVITCMGRNYHTIPYILDRLWDIDDKVRRHTYLHMSSYPVRSYKVSQRLTLLEQGLNDRNESVKKVVTTVMLQQWIESYQKDLVSLIGALKLDSNESDLNRFRKIGKQALKEIFRRQSKEDIIACLPLETENTFYRCVPHAKLNIELSFYWQCLIEYLQTEMAEELDLIIPELSVFCSYVEDFCQSHKREMDKFEAMEFQYILLSLMEILHAYDLGDEIGRGNLQKLLECLLKNYNLDEKVIEVIVKCAENLITNQDRRHEFFLEIINDLCGLNTKQQDLVHDRNLISELLANSTDAALNLKLSSLKVKILDLEEQEMNYVQTKDYVRAQQIIEHKNAVTEEFTNILRPLLDKRNNENGSAVQPQFSKVVKNECILRSLQVTYYMVVSNRVKSLGHATCCLYNDFIFRNIASNQIVIRDWALKCGAAFSMLYEPLAKDVFEELYAQFFKNHNIRIWETAITCIFELLDRYGVDSFVVQEEQNKSKKNGRQLYNTLEFIDGDEDTGHSNTLGQVIFMMSHLLESCDDMCIIRAIINGFCRLILHGHIENREILEKLLIRYFNPSTEPEINQILSVFLENLIQNRKQRLLQPCLMTTVNSVLSASYDSPLHDIRPETITHFIIDTTRPDALSGINNENSHNMLASIFLSEMVNNPNNKELCKLLSKDLLSLELNLTNNTELKSEMKEMADKIIKNKIDPRAVKNVIDFKDMLDGVINIPRKLPDIVEFDSDEEGCFTGNDPTDGCSDLNTNKDQNAEDIGNKPQIIVNDADENTQPSKPENKGTTDSTLVNIQSNTISPSSVTTVTTFGCENSTEHNLLRRKSLLSRNSSTDSANTVGNSTTVRQRKIRIEARIDSDKKTPQRTNTSEKIATRARRNLRYNKADSSNHKTVEPEIIEMILISPKSQLSVSSSALANSEDASSSQTIRLEQELLHSKDQHSVENATNETIRGLSEDTDHSQLHKETHNRSIIANDNSKSVSRQRRSMRRNHEDYETSTNPSATSEELDTSEVITTSPTSVPFENSVRLRANASARSTRSRTFREGSNKNGKVLDNTSLRNGRKRVRNSPVKKLSASSEDASSPVRKQPCLTLGSPSSSFISCKIDKTSSGRTSKTPLQSQRPISTPRPLSNKEADKIAMNEDMRTPKQTIDKSVQENNVVDESQIEAIVTRNSAKKEFYQT
ncbi:chromosome associated protein G [Haematobia irritans]|uniref:chromosome associated protein G n=1 Tax=Haematobia irritans TaxID=7368 RepID=UPI003F501A20